MSHIFSGAAFGAALTASGIYAPQVIRSQFKLEDWQLAKTFLAATATSAALTHFYQSFGNVQLSAKGSAPIGICGKFDGNVIGGILLGTGMALASSCPGGILVRVALGERTAYYACAGALAAGVITSGIIRPYMACQRTKKSTEDVKLTVHDHFGVSRTLVFISLETLFVALFTAMFLASPSSSPARYRPLVSGLLFGLSQLVSILTRSTLVGVSSFYEEFGDAILAPFKEGGLPIQFSSSMFSLAIIPAARVLVRYIPSIAAPPGPDISPLASAAGGLCMVLGARIAGGCTSGHGISGVSTLSMSSLITMAMTVLSGGFVTRYL